MASFSTDADDGSTQSPTSTGKMKRNELFQYSLISALMDGVASRGITIKEIMSRGNFGLGTFQNLVGELIVLDGYAYRMNADGSVMNLPRDSMIGCPFAMVTNFQPQISDLKPGPIHSKEAVLANIEQRLPHARNHFIAVIVKQAVFRTITVRTVGGQKHPHEGLLSVGKHQTNTTFENTEGTLVGFRCPEYMQGISVGGLHLHYISKDRSHGGHVIDFAGDGAISMAKISRFTMELPDDEEFEKATLELDDGGIKEVEGSGRSS